MRMLTILRESGGVDARASTRSLLAVRECKLRKARFTYVKTQSPCTSNNFTFARPLIGERAKRVRRYLLMSMESRDISEGAVAL